MFVKTWTLALGATAPLALLACADAPAPLPAAPPAADWAAACEDFDDWDKPGPPFQVYGNTYYVGTCGIGAILVAGENGHVLIDTGTEAGAHMVLDNVRTLGFDARDISVLLHSHEHFDHIGGLAYVQAQTGARLLASPAAAPVIERGQVGRDDPQAGILDPFSPAHVDELVVADTPVVVGKLRLNPLATPGHTAGALSWHWQSCNDAGACKTIAYVDSLSPVSSDAYRFSDHPAYVQAYRDSIARVAVLDCDILLTPHPSASGMRDKLLAGDLGGEPSCRQYAAGITARLDERLAQEDTQ